MAEITATGGAWDADGPSWQIPPLVSGSYPWIVTTTTNGRPCPLCGGWMADGSGHLCAGVPYRPPVQAAPPSRLPDYVPDWGGEA